MLGTVEGFEADRMPPQAESYAAVLTLHPWYVLDEREGTLTELAEADESAVLDEIPHLSMAGDDNSTERSSRNIFERSDGLIV